MSQPSRPARRSALPLLFPTLLPAFVLAVSLFAASPAMASTSAGAFARTSDPSATAVPLLLARDGHGGRGLGLPDDRGFDPYGKDDPYSKSGSLGSAGRHKSAPQSLHGPDRNHAKVARDRAEKKQERDGDGSGDHRRNVDRDRPSRERSGGTSDDRGEGDSEQ